MNEIITKDFYGSSIRIIIIDGKEYFIAKDVAKILGYKRSADAISQHCKNSMSFQQILEIGKSPTLDLQLILGNSWKQTKVIPESDVWRLIIKSTMPEAEKIEKWIMEDVLPSIRKTGSYSISQNSTIPKSEIQELTEYSKQVFELLNLVQAQDSISLYRFSKIFEKQNRKTPLELFNINLDNQFFIPTELGKMVGKTPIEINKILEFQGLQFADNGVWKLTEKGQKVGIEIFGRFLQLKWKISVLDNI